MTFIVRTCDDEERIGHVLGRIARYLAAHQLTAEIVVARVGRGPVVFPVDGPDPG